MKSFSMPAGADVALGRTGWEWSKLRKENPDDYFNMISNGLTDLYIYVSGTDRWFDVKTGRRIEGKVLSKLYRHVVPKDDKDRPIPAEAIALSSNSLRRATDVAYRPGREIFFKEGDEWFVNGWDGFGIQPSAGDASIWVDHVEWICNNDPEQYNRVFDFLASLVQRPEVKIRRMILIIGESGIGKDRILDPIRLVLGRKNCHVPRKDDLMSKFNKWAEVCQLAWCSEFKLNSGEEFERVKELCTNDDIVVEGKGADHKMARNCASLFGFSNHDNACPLPDDDRRIDVIKSFVKRKDDRYYQRLFDFCNSLVGASIVMHWLLKRDLSAFNPNSPAVMSQSKADMMALSVEPMHQWLDAKLLACEGPFSRDVVSTVDIEDYALANNRRANLRQIGQWMSGKGHKKLGQFGPKLGRKILWAVRNVPRWVEAAKDAVWSEYTGQPSSGVPTAAKLLVDSIDAGDAADEIVAMIGNAAKRGDMRAIEYLSKKLVEIAAA